MQKTASVGSLAILMLGAVPEGRAEDSRRFDLGLRTGIAVANGKPANDMPGYGIYGRYPLGAQWSFGLGVDRTEYDYEEPARIIGIDQSSSLEPIDALAEATIASAWLERTFAAPEAPTTWFAGSGVGLASIDVPTVTGPREDGGNFDIRTKVKDEIIVSILGGVRRKLGAGAFVEFTVRAEQHFADWKSTDQVSGVTGSVGDYFAYGAHLGLGIRF